ncbi:membrane protein [Lacticaseibacillus brantae DSM 23927]|uniref:Membrane protein n=1 Tax=Lacticaseibacillus brantae DSM 23927 TaxID=1423727 RepID=A0A0R2B8Q4_9LACO|nr:membrane protein [Lacticaseibacillus brantae DSM 23927]
MLKGQWNVTTIVIGGEILVTLAIAVWRWFFFRYQITPDTITIQRGLIAKKTSHIPRHNIQTIQQRQWFFFKPLHVLELQIETSGHEGSTPEAVLPGVPESVLAQLAVPTTSQSVEVQNDLSYQINASDLTQYALTSLGIFPILAAIFWLFGRLDDLLPKTWFTQAQAQLLMLGTVVIVGLGILLLLFGLLISFLREIQRYYHFTLQQTDHQLVTERGFFQRNQVSVATSKIQALRFSQNVLRQGLKITTIQALTASNAAADEQDKDLVLIPVIKTPVALPTIKRFVDWVPQPSPAVTLVPPRTRWRYARNVILGNAVVIGLLFAVTGQWHAPIWWLLAFIWLVIAGGLGRYAARQGQMGMSDTLLVAQVGHLFGRTRYLIPKAKIQSVEIRQPVLLRHQFAHVVINVRHGNSNQIVRVNYLPKAFAQSVWQWYAPSLPNKNLD